MRKLASIQQIEAIEPIPGKDRIELAHVQGWTVVVQKGEYKPGDLTVYVEIDSVLPQKPEFEFLRKKNFRIKTMKLTAQTEEGTKYPIYSQGICFPVSILPGNVIDPILSKELLVGTDVTEFLGIKKYDEYDDVIEQCDSKTKNGWLKNFLFSHKITRPLAKKLFVKKTTSENFPSFVAKTDETRIQNMPYLLENKEVHYVGREKIDGQSGTFILKRTKRFFGDKFEFIVCSRNRRLVQPDNSSFWSVAKKYNIKDVLMDLIEDKDWICIQGEVIGPGIQGNKYKLKEYDLYCFNLINPLGKCPCVTAEPLLGQYGLRWAPLVVEDYVLPDTVNDVLSYATGKSQLCDTLREGVVFRNYEHDTSFKAVSPDFLIKNDA